MKHYLIQEETLPEAYHESLKTLYYYGEECPCPDYNTNQKEISLTFQVNNPLKEHRISRLYPGGFYELQQYELEILDGILDFKIGDGKAWEYTYHDRYIKQMPFIIEELKRNPYSRRAIVVTRDFNIDSNNNHPACLINFQFMVRNNKLHMKIMMRSNDSTRATFMNAWAFIRLQERVADTLGYEVGTYTHTANSFHVYQPEYKLLESYVNRIEANKDLTYEYEGFYKDMMLESMPSIMEQVNKLKNKGV